MPRLRGIALLDVKLGVRMLGKQPGLTLVSGLALALGIPIGLAPLQLMNAFNATLPVVDGHRVVGLRNRDVARSNSEYGSIHEFEEWRSELRSFAGMAAVKSDPHNVMTEDGRSESVRGSEMTASGFEVLRTRPLLGRVLLAADEMPGADPVVMISYDLWQRRFGGASDVLGQWVRIGDTRRMVVGVMPQGFLFPYRDHLWLPFRARAADYDWGSGPEIWIFGRLADGIGIERARAELAPIGLRTAADHPETHEHFRPEVVPVTWAFTGMRASFAQIMPVQLIALLLLAVACGNVGTLTLARTASRSSEIAVRSAIGASRSRIISQLFIEALVLSSIAGGVGLLLGNLVTSRLQLLTNSRPYWWSPQVRPSTIALAAGLAVFCAVLAGVIPAFEGNGPRCIRQPAAHGCRRIRRSIRHRLDIADRGRSRAVGGIPVGSCRDITKRFP